MIPRLAVAIVVIAALLTPAARAAPTDAAPAQAAPCAKESKRLKTFRKGMRAKKRQYFRTHKGKKARRAFVRRQTKRLKTLQRARRLCLARQKPPPPAPAPPQSSPPPPATGPPGGGPALNAMTDVITADAEVTDAEVSGSVVRTQVQLAFKKQATVDAVNDLLKRIDGRIVSSRRGVLMAVVEVPDPGSLAGLDQLLASLAGEPVVRSALPVFLPPVDELPEHITFGTADTSFIRSQAAVRAPAAWNARAALAGRTAPTLVIADHFGDGPPGAGTDITLTGGAFADNARSSDHGYMVLGITSGSYDATGTGSVADEAVTGMFPGTLRVRAADVTAGLAGAVLHDRMLELIEASPGNVVLNTSLSGWPCETQEEAAAYCTEEFAAEAGAVWAEKVRGTDPGSIGTNLEGAFVHATSAGNVEDVTGALGAPVNSEWTAATLLPLEDAGGVPIPNLSNTLVVENATATTTEPFRPGCVAASSEFGGTVAGVGSPVHSFASPTASETFDDGGTSAATPQVAGLAAYVWTLAPTLSPAQLAALLERTARPSDCDGTRVIDAYAALLASAVPPARTAILDIADSAGEAGADNRFDGNDLDEFLAGFQAQDGKIDYGRFDLNGDGVTRAEPGVTRRDRVALTADDTFTEVAQDVDGVTAWFDERSLSDENVLCYAAYSSLWQGTAAERTEDLGLESCVRPHVSHTFPQSVTNGVSNTLTISVSSLELLDAAGQPMPVEDVYLELDQSDGVTLGAASGRTNADGVFTTSVSVAEGQTSLTIDVTAYDDPGGQELGSDTVTAQVDLPGTASIDEVFGEIWVRDGEQNDDKFVESGGAWSLSGGAGGTSVTAVASVQPDDDALVYSGSGTIRTTGGDGLIGGGVTVSVTGGPVRWNLTQRVTGSWPSHSLFGGCYVDNAFVGITGGGRGGVWQPGTHSVSHNCGGGGVPGIDAEMTWTLRIGD